MKFSILHKTASLFLAFVILISSLGYGLDIHYCGDEILEYSFIGKVNSCEKEEINDLTNGSVKKKGCCDLDQFKIETSSQYQLSSMDILPVENSIIGYFLLNKIICFNLNEVNTFNPNLNTPPEIFDLKLYK